MQKEIKIADQTTLENVLELTDEEKNILTTLLSLANNTLGTVSDLSSVNTILNNSTYGLSAIKSSLSQGGSEILPVLDPSKYSSIRIYTISGSSSSDGSTGLIEGKGMAFFLSNEINYIYVVVDGTTIVHTYNITNTTIAQMPVYRFEKSIRVSGSENGSSFKVIIALE